MARAAHTLTDTRATRSLGRDDGVFHLGRPGWLTGELFDGLLRESREQRAGAEKIREQHFAELGPVGCSLRESDELRNYVETNAGVSATASGKGNYRYYDIPHSHVVPHIDTDQFALNVIVMLEHDWVSERRSGLLLFPHGKDPVTVLLEVGEVILFYARRVIHARTPISDNNDERAVNLGIGFTPAGPVDAPEFWHPAEGWSPA
ncbi:hypothetical protein [Phytomonospora endophytica]|uniref:Fe2OG dioxygenase domain-containing protein n=1 Tax=Phytomonospora endophytica TaxID=714109 RepID=A0A841FNG0_9ACTN|nr:hypothetical protein [Phytomonospora endophytica]MBB6038851.1 hypothetical protein [Phytomonospora endophytica]GIG68354.1 hypothetical protein Pen01_46490 [Phytomonospora endophytica]